MHQTYEVRAPAEGLPLVGGERRKVPGKPRLLFENLQRRFKSVMGPELLKRTPTWNRNRIRCNPRHRETTRQVSGIVLPLTIPRKGPPLFLLFDLRVFGLLSFTLDLDLVTGFGTYRGLIRVANLWVNEKQRESR